MLPLEVCNIAPPGAHKWCLSNRISSRKIKPPPIRYHHRTLPFPLHGQGLNDRALVDVVCCYARSCIIPRLELMEERLSWPKLDWIFVIKKQLERKCWLTVGLFRKGNNTALLFGWLLCFPPLSAASTLLAGSIPSLPSYWVGRRVGVGYFVLSFPTWWRRGRESSS